MDTPWWARRYSTFRLRKWVPSRAVKGLYTQPNLDGLVIAERALQASDANGLLMIIILFTFISPW